MSEAESAVATPPDIQPAEHTSPGGGHPICDTYSSTSPKIRELKERYEASHQAVHALNIAMPDTHNRGISERNSRGK